VKGIRIELECKRLWLLKNSIWAENAPEKQDRKCLAIREDRSYRILERFYFYEFGEKEFFNTHA